MEPDNNIPLASRSGISNPFGKCTEEIDTKVPFEIKAGLDRIAHDLGMSRSELLREIVMVRVLGIDVVRNINEQRLLRINGVEGRIGETQNGSR